MIGVAEQVGRGQDRPGRDLLGDILGRDIAHFQVAALHGDQLGALLEQRAAVIAVERELVADAIGEVLHHLGANVLRRKDGREVQFHLVLCRRGRAWRDEGRGHTGGQQRASREFHHGCYLPSQMFTTVNFRHRESCH